MLVRLAAVAYADQLIRAGECDLVVAGGMESMTSAPHLLPGSRGGYKYGNVTVIDSMAHDGLEDVFTDQAMGSPDRKLQHRRTPGHAGRSRRLAARSHQRAAAATKSGVMAEEIVEVRVPQRRGDDVVVTTDEGIRSG